MIRHLLWVCGPNGAGKTTFISQLAAGQLSRQLVDQLPANSENWPQVTPKGLVLCKQASLLPRLTIEYSLTRPLRLQLSNFGDDPYLQLFKLAEEITIVHLKPSERRLASQLSHRQQQTRLRKASYSSVGSALRAAMSSRLSRSRSRLAVLLAVRSRSALWDQNEEARQARRNGKYRDGVERLYERWEDYIQREICRGRSIKELFLQPDPNSRQGDVTWLPAAPERPRQDFLAKPLQNRFGKFLSFGKFLPWRWGQGL
jgi:GTPase SAR1 family protein